MPEKIPFIELLRRWGWLNIAILFPAALCSALLFDFLFSGGDWPKIGQANAVSLLLFGLYLAGGNLALLILFLGKSLWRCGLKSK